jgi:hypothetical protein
MSKLLCIVLLALAPLMLVLPAAATDLLPYEYSYPAEGADLLPYDGGYHDDADLLPHENGYSPEPYVRPRGYIGYPDQAYGGVYGRPPYPAYYGRPDYRDLARYCQPDAWAVANGYLPPLWCIPRGQERARAPFEVAPPHAYGRGSWSGNYPIRGYAYGTARARNY